MIETVQSIQKKNTWLFNIAMWVLFLVFIYLSVNLLYKCNWLLLIFQAEGTKQSVTQNELICLTGLWHYKHLCCLNVSFC